MQFINTHSHVYVQRFDADRHEVIERAKQAGVSHILLPDINALQRPHLQTLVAQYPDICVPMLGVHPTYIKQNYKEELDAFETAFESAKHVCAIGEIGIDLYRDTTFVAEQKDAFLYQVRFAQKHNLPIAIHARNAFPHIFDMLSELPNQTFRGVFHCFSGTLKDAYKAIQLGFYIGIGGVVTYKNSGLPPIVSEIDLSHILLETDDPWLPPVPFRGKRNEPSYITYIAQKVAEIKQCSLLEVSQKTTQNAIQLFSL